MAGGGGWGPWPWGSSLIRLPRPRLPRREVLPDSTPATSTTVPLAPVTSNPGLRDSAFSSELALPTLWAAAPRRFPLPGFLRRARPLRGLSSLFLQSLSLRVGFCAAPAISFLFLSSFLFRVFPFCRLRGLLDFAPLRLCSCLSAGKLCLGLWHAFPVVSRLVSRTPCVTSRNSLRRLIRAGLWGVGGGWEVFFCFRHHLSFL